MGAGCSVGVSGVGGKFLLVLESFLGVVLEFQGLEVNLFWCWSLFSVFLGVEL